MTRWSTTIFSISVFGHVYTYMHSYTAAHIPSNLHTYLPTYMHTSTINPYILDRKYSPPTKKCYPLHTRLNTYRHSYHCLSVWVCMCTYIYIYHTCTIMYVLIFLEWIDRWKMCVAQKWIGATSWWRQVLAKLVSLLRQNRHLLRTGRTTLRQPTDQNGYCTALLPAKPGYRQHFCARHCDEGRRGR